MKIYSHNYNNILNDVLSCYEKTTNLLEAEAYITWNDVVKDQVRIIEMCKEYKKKSIVVEHGMKAVSDYAKNLKDISNGMGGRKLLADHICVWGEASKKILLEAGTDEKRIHVVGSPVVWDHDYVYKSRDEIKTVRFNAGLKVFDPKDQREWLLEGCRSYIPQNEVRNVVAFFPHHDYTPYAIEQNRKVYEQIKNRKDIFIKLSGNYGNREKENPFLDELNMPAEERQHRNIVIETTVPQNLLFVKELLKRCKCVISTIPGTINGICAAMNVPVIQPRIDWHWRNEKGETIYDDYASDYICEIEEINKTIMDIEKEDVKREIRRKFAIEYMGIEKGNPTVNIRKVIDGN